MIRGTASLLLRRVPPNGVTDRAVAPRAEVLVSKIALVVLVRKLNLCVLWPLHATGSSNHQELIRFLASDSFPYFVHQSARLSSMPLIHVESVNRLVACCF